MKRDTDELYITSCNLILCNITVPRLNNMGIEEVQKSQDYENTLKFGFETHCAIGVHLRLGNS